jgi:hypothetical protein
MATVTLTFKDLEFIYSQLNYLRNYVGVYSLDPMEHVIAVIPAPPPPPTIVENYFQKRVDAE